jgi:capsular polysaccharide export protein
MAPGGVTPRPWAAEALWQAVPHLAAFFPEGPPQRGPRPPGAAELRLAEGPWQAPAFGPRRRAVGLLLATGRDPVEAALALPASAAAIAQAAALQPLWPEPIDPRLLAATRWADPLLGRPSGAAEGLALLAEWRRQAAMPWFSAACLGMDGWKRAAIAACFAREGPPPPFAATEAEALALAAAARARGEAGAIAVWATRAAPGLAARCATAGVPLLWVEDGFLRSVGLGVHYVPSASPGRRRILVPGQVEDDAAVRLGAGRIRTNLALLEAVRRAEPDAFLVFRPHPDVETGYRRGHVPRRAALRFADVVVSRGDIGGLFGQVEAIHTIGSLAGFEALLRGLAVTTWGRPFYAGWGLTTDMEPPPRRGRALSLDALVAGALIRYPRYLDPLTQLPCGPEVLLERLADPAGWPKLPALRRGWVLWWRYQGWWLKQLRRAGLWRR